MNVIANDLAIFPWLNLYADAVIQAGFIVLDCPTLVSV